MSSEIFPVENISSITSARTSMTDNSCSVQSKGIPAASGAPTGGADGAVISWRHGAVVLLCNIFYWRDTLLQGLPRGVKYERGAGDSVGKGAV